MTADVKRHSWLVIMALIASGVSAAAILLCIWAVRTEAEIFLYLIPTIFWLALILEQVFIWKANSILKKIVEKEKIRKIQAKPGIIAPFQTKLGVIADISFIVSLVVFTVLVILNWGNDWLQFVCLFLIVLSFRVHCIANGKNYYYKMHVLSKRG